MSHSNKNFRHLYTRPLCRETKILSENTIGLEVECSAREIRKTRGEEQGTIYYSGSGS